MRTSRFLNKAFSVVALLCLGLIQVMPMTVSAAPAAHPAHSVASACNGDSLLNVCIPDGTTPNFNDAIKVIAASDGKVTTENGSTNLVAHYGDTVHIPFAFTDVSALCATVPAFTPSLLVNSLISPVNFTTPTSKNFPGGGLVFGDGVVGPTDGTANDTAYGYFEFVIKPADVAGGFMNFQLNSGTWFCGAGAKPNDQINIDNNNNGNDNPIRRVQVVGAAFTLVQSPPLPDHVSLHNSTAIAFAIQNLGSAASFTISSSVSPSQPPIPTTELTLFSGVSDNGTGTGNLGALNKSASGTITIGPIPDGYGPNTTVTITVIGTVGVDSSQQQLVIPLPVWQPAVSIAITSDQTLYKPGDTATYTLTITNSGQLPLGAFAVQDNLDGTVDLSKGTANLTSVSGMAPGSFGTVTFTYVVKGTDPNPLIDSATVAAIWTPVSPDVGPQVRVVGNSTYQVNVVSANINLSFGPNSPTPNYAKPGTAISGTVVIVNTGTQDVNNVVTNVQLVDGSDSTIIYSTGILSAPSVPVTLLAGASVTPTFSLTLPASVPPTVTSVNLVITLSGLTTQGVTVNRTLTQPLDVVFSSLHVIVTSDAPSGVVSRGQIVTYTVTIQNISAGSVTGIQLTTDSLGLLNGAPITIPDLAPAGTKTGPTVDTYTLPALSLKTFTVTASTPNPLIESVAAAFGPNTATGRLSLTISDVQLTVNNTALCVMPAGSTNCGAITNNQVQIGQTVRFFVQLVNVGQSTATNVTACQGNTPSCVSGDGNYISLTYPGPFGVLETLKGAATGTYDLLVPSGATSPFVALITVSVKDQNGLTVLFRGSATLQLVSSNAYWTITKTASVTTAFVGDTITYTVSACYNPDSTVKGSAPPALTNVVATDPFTGSQPVLLSVNGSTAVSPLPSLQQTQCAIGIYQIVADDTLLLGAPGPIQLTNVVTFSAANVAAATATQSATVNLSNPLFVTKAVAPQAVKAGEAVTYTFTFKNIGTKPITGLSASDPLLPNAPFSGLPDLAAGASQIVTYPTNAGPVSGTTDATIVNTVTAKGTVNGVADTGSAITKLDIAPPLIVTKTVDNSGPFFYDPPITYTVKVKNTSNNPVKLDDASDTLGSKASPSVNGSVNVAVTGPNPLRNSPLNTTILASQETATFSYSALPADIEALAGGPNYSNTVTITAEVTPFGASSKFTTTGSTPVTIFQPLYLFNGCPDFSYYGWSQVSHWHFVMTNGSDASNPFALTNIAVSVNGLTGLSALTLKSTSTPVNSIPAPGPDNNNYAGRPKVTSDFDWTIPWQSTLKNFNAVSFDISYTATDKNNKSFNFNFNYTVKLAGCFGYQVGPPLVVTKTPSVANAKPGDVVTYTLTITNPMTDDPNILPDSNGVSSGSVTGVTAVDQTFAPNTNLGLSFTSGNQTIRPGGTASLIVPISHTVTGSDPSPLINKVFVNGKLAGAIFPTPLIGTATVILPNPLIVVTLNASPPDVIPGGTITYDAVIQNNSQTAITITGASTDSTPINLQDPTTNLNKWLLSAPFGIIPPNGKVTIPGLYQVQANTDPTKTGPFTSTLTLNYSIQTTTPTSGQATASATVNVLNPNLRVLLTTQPAIVVTYGQTIVYTEKIFNPGLENVTNLTVTHVLLAPSDAVGNWKDSKGNDLGPIINPATYILNAGDFITRTVTHLVTTIDNSPLTFVVTANGQYLANGNPPPILVQDKKISTVTISSAQLLIYANPDKTNIAPGDNDNVTLTLTNIGSVAITTLNLTALLSDINGNPFPALAVPAPVFTTPAIPGSNSPGNQLLPLAATGASYVVQVPKPLPGNYPNPLILTFTASGTTAEGLSFQNVTATLIFHILQPNINIIETPQVAAVPVNGTVTYDVVVTNPGVPDLTITSVTDNNSSQPINLIFPGNPTTASPTGTLKTNESARGTTTAVVANLVPNPFVHSSTARGTINGSTNVIDTYASTVNVLGSGLTATYSANPQQGSVGGTISFTVTVTNTSNIDINNVQATDLDHGSGAFITLTDSKGVTGTSLTLKSNQSASGVFQYSPTVAGSFIEHVQITGVDATGNNVAASATAPFSALGIGLAFVQLPTPDKLSAKVGDLVTFSFTLKNTATSSNNDLDTINVVCLSNANCGALSPALATLAAGATSPTETVTYTVQPGDALGTGTVTLTFQASGQQKNIIPANTTRVNAIGQFSVTTGGLLLTKTASPTSGKPGDTITYTVNLTNTNASALTVSSITDTIAGSLSKLTGVTLNANGTASGSYTYVIPIGAPSTITNSVNVTFSVGGGAAQTATAKANVAVSSSSSGGLTVNVTPSLTAAKVGDQVTYTIAVTNSGTTTINTLQGTSTLGVTTTVGGNISPNQTIIFTTTPYTIPAGATGSVTNVITVSGTDSTGALNASGSASVVIIGPSGLSVTKTASANTAKVGDTITYTIQIANFGSNPLTINSLTDSDSAEGGSLIGLNGTSIAAGTLAAPITVTHQVTAADPVTLQDVVTVTATDSTNAVISTTATATVINITSGNGLIISAIPNKTVAQTGDTITYTVTIANVTSGSTAMTITNLAATFAIPGQATKPISTLLVSSLLPGAQTTATFNVTANAALANPLVLVVAATGSDANSNSYQASSTTPPVTVAAVGANYAASLSADHTNIPIAGSQINFTFTVVNTSSSTLTVSAAFGTQTISALFDHYQSNVSFIRNQPTRPDLSGIHVFRPVAVITPAKPFANFPATLAPGASTSVTFAYTVKATDTTALTAAVDLTVNTAAKVTFSATVQPTLASLSVSTPTSTCASPCIAKPGDSIPLTFTVSNTGSVDLSSLKFTVNNGVVFTPSPTLTSLAAGVTSSSLTFFYTVPSTLPVANPVALVITVQGTPSGGQPVSASSGPYNYSVINPAMTVSISSPALPATVADLSTVTFNMVVQNNSTGVAGAAVPLNFNSGAAALNLTSPSSGATITTLSVTLKDSSGATITTLAPGAIAFGSATYTIKSSDPTTLAVVFSVTACAAPNCAVSILGTAGGQINVTRATVTPTITGTVTAGSGSAVCTATNGLTVVQTATASTVKPGASVTFTIKVTNSTGAGINGIAFNDTLPAGFTAGTATTDVGSAAVTGNALTVAIGTLNAGQSANITFPATVSSSAASGTFTNTAAVSVSGTASSSTCSAAVSITVANSASVLPVTGFSAPGGDNSALGGLLILAMLLSSVLVFGMTLSRNNKGGGNQPLLLAGGLVAVLVVLLLLAIIGVSLINKARTAPAATGTALALNPTAMIVTLPGKTYIAPTMTPFGPPPTIAPTLTDVPPNTPVPPPSAVPTAAPPFQPVGERSFYMPRLQLPGGPVGLPITELPLVNSTWNVNALGHIVGHLEQTSWLGNSGNTVLVAHIQLAYNDYGPFLRLGDTQLGDLIYVSDHGQFYTYQVVDMRKVNPTEVDVTYPTPNPILTLITCTTWDAQKGAFAQRLVVIAKLIKSPGYSA